MDVLKVTAQELCENGKIPVRLFESEETMFRTMADEMLDVIRNINADGKTAVLIVPVGPVGQYPYFVEIVNSQGISLKNTCFINMDEYAYSNDSLLEPEHALSFQGFMERHVYGKIRTELLPPENWRVFPHPSDLKRIPKLIESIGGVDACFGGIGINGHVAFNEPPEPGEECSDQEFLRRSVHMGSVSRETLVVNSIFDLHGAYDQMPPRFVTVGMKEIAGARRIRLFCLRQWHGVVARKASFGEKTCRFPVSLLQGHSDISIGLPEAVANLR